MAGRKYNAIKTKFDKIVKDTDRTGFLSLKIRVEGDIHFIFHIVFKVMHFNIFFILK